MNKSLSIWLTTYSLCGAFGVSAQCFATFGTWNDGTTLPPDPSLQKDITLCLAGPVLTFGATFSSEISFQPAAGTPANTVEEYTVSFSNVKVGIASTDRNSLGLGVGSDLILDFGTISQKFNVNTGSSPTSLKTVSLTPVSASTTKTFTLSGGTDSFKVRWISVDTIVSILGGKGVGTHYSVDSLNGFTQVPEPAGLGSLTTIVLFGVSAWRMHRGRQLPV
jgi:hypothetical protein